jgi:polysaccharide export outer membrane protein
LSITLGCSYFDNTPRVQVIQSEIQAADVEGVVDQQDEPGPNYVIGSGDVLSISVWRDDALTGTVVVLPDGTFAFPLVGEIEAAGKTVAQLKEEMVKKIDTYVPDPVLSVSVQQVNSMRFFIIGKVNGPGAYPIIADMDVLQALSLARGLNQFADRKKIKILRREGSQTKIFLFNYKEVVEGENLEQNIQLERGDVIIVP